jgi:putative transcriptional regulator
MSERAEFRMSGRRLLAKPYKYTASGLDNIYLLNGVRIENTPYGPMVSIENIAGLHRAIGLQIIEKPEPMSGGEFRFLRKQMGLTQAELAAVMHTTDQTVANYEKGKTAELGPADPLMRLTYLLHVIPEETRADALKAAAERLGASARVKLAAVPRRKIVQKWQEYGHGRERALARLRKYRGRLPPGFKVDRDGAKARG